MQEYSFKGTYVAQIRDWMETDLGPGSFAERFGLHGDIWRGPVLAGSWYDARAVNDTLRQIAEERNLDFSTTVADLAGKTSRKDLPTVYRVFFSVFSSSAGFRFMPKLCPQDAPGHLNRFRTCRTPEERVEEE